MKQYSHILLIALLVFFAFGCEKVINVDIPEHTPVLVPNSRFTTDSLWFVHMSKSVSVLQSDDPEAVENARVEIYEDGVLLDTLTHFGDGLYLSMAGASPEVGKTYSMIASAPGFESVSAVSAVPAMVEITDVAIEDSVSSVGGFGESYTSEIRVTFNDPPGPNYYILSLVRTVIAISPFDTFEVQTFPFIWTDDPDASEYFTSGIPFRDQLFDGQEKTLILNADAADLDIVADQEIWLLSVTEDYYKYNLSAAAIRSGGFNPFTEPVLSHTNIEGGLGIFAGYAQFEYPLD